MKIVFTCGIRTLPGTPQSLADLYRDHLEEAVLAEELGFDCVWASEHHFSPDAWSPSPFTFLAAVAGRTERVRLGTFVLLLPLHNPLRVAEDVAVLDNISEGRVDLGVGVGSAPNEFATFGIPVEGRLGRTFEALRIIERCFTGERVQPPRQILQLPQCAPDDGPGAAAGAADPGRRDGRAERRLDGAARLRHGGRRRPRPRPVHRGAARARPRSGVAADRLGAAARACRRDAPAGVGRGRGRAAPGAAFLPHARQSGRGQPRGRAARRLAAARRIPRGAGDRPWRPAVRGRHARTM